MLKRMRMMLAVSIAVVSAAALSGCGGQPAKPSNAADQLPVVKVFSLQSVTAQGVSGKVAANETVQIYSKLPGRIAKVNVEEGSQVKEGDVLVQLDTGTYEEQVKQAQAGLAAAKAKLADALNGARKEDLQAAEGAVQQAQAAADQTQAALNVAVENYNEAQNHYDKGEITKNDMDKATMAYKSAKAAHDQAAGGLLSAKARLAELKAGATPETIDALKAGVAGAQAACNMAKLTLQDATITSPIDGTVVKKFVNAGEMAFTSMPSGTQLLELVSMDPAKVEVSVPESLVGQLKMGSKADISIPGMPGQNFQGTISFISPVSDPNNNTFPVKLDVQNPKHLLHAGTVANVYFSANSSVKKLELPKGAIITKDGKSYVFKLEGGAVHRVDVQIVPKDKDWVYVKNGSSLQDNDKIVISPSPSLTDGLKVNAE